MAFTTTSNRGISDFPQSYYSAWNAYNPNQGMSNAAAINQWNQRKNAEAAARSQNAQTTDWMQLLGQMVGGGAQQAGGVQGGAAIRRPVGGDMGAGRQLRGGGWGGSPTGMVHLPANGGGGAIPPATTNPQVPVGGGGTGGVGSGIIQAESGITSGQLSNESIQKAMQELLNGGKRSMFLPSSMSYTKAGGKEVSGGVYGDLMSQQSNRNASEFERAAAQQQADMQHAFEVARASGGLQNMQLASDVNRENVTHGVMQRNTMLKLISRLLGGLGGVI